MTTQDLKIKVAIIKTKFIYKIRDLERNKLISEGYTENWF